MSRKLLHEMTIEELLEQFGEAYASIQENHNLVVEYKGYSLEQKYRTRLQNAIRDKSLFQDEIMKRVQP